MKVIIGVDPHKATHQAVAVNDREAEIDRISVRATRTQTERLLAWSTPFTDRVWAVEGAGGLGYLLAQQLVDAGETVVDVPATLAARTRVLASGRSNKTDPNDAWSVAVTALRHDALRQVAPASHTEVLRLLAKRNTDIGNQRCRLVSRLHSLLVELAAGGIAKEINASDVDRFLAEVTPTTPGEQTRFDLAVELLDDIRRLDNQLKVSHRRIRVAVTASATTVTDLFGIGPIIAAALIGYTGDIGRFRDRDRYAAYNGTAPVEFSCGGRTVHRLSQRGNRHLNHALHMAAICQLRHPHSAGRAYFDRKVAEGKTKKEALRALKRQISNAVYRQLILDQATGLTNLPSHSFEINTAWLQLVLVAHDLLAWTRLLVLDGDLASAEPKRLRYCLFHTAGQIATTGRQRFCRLSSYRPWTRELVDAFARLNTIRLQV